MIDRAEVLDKYGGRCAYCGKEITLATMQVDHVQSQRNGGTDDMDNLNPACRLCNHYKRGGGLESFREKLMTLHERLVKIYIVNVAIDHGIVKVEPFDGRFYFERAKK